MCRTFIPGLALESSFRRKGMHLFTDEALPLFFRPEPLTDTQPPQNLTSLMLLLSFPSHKPLLNPSSINQSPCPNNKNSPMSHPMAEEEEGKTAKELGGGAAERGGGEISVKIDSRVLLCRICSQPLKLPIFKCEAGHVLCSPCMEKFREVGFGYVLRLGIFCVLCCKTTSYCRCIELEGFIDTVKVPCSNKIYGCSEFIRYHQKEKHESGCTHAPCYCPENGCTFIGPTGSLLNHFVDVHGWSPTYFRYNKPLKFSMALDCRFTLLLGEDQSMFLLTNTLTGIGHALTMVCVRAHQSEPSYSCNISSTRSVSGGKAEGRLVFQKDPLVSSSSLLAGVQLGKFFLLVPPGLVDYSSGELIIHIRIDRPA